MRNSVFSLSPRRAITGKHKAEAAIRLFSEPRTERTGFSPGAPRVLNMFDLAVKRPEGPSHLSPGWSAFCGTLGNRDVWNGPVLKGRNRLHGRDLSRPFRAPLLLAVNPGFRTKRSTLG